MKVSQWPRAFYIHQRAKQQKRRKFSVGSIDSKSTVVAMWFSHHKVAKIVVCKVSYALLAFLCSAPPLPHCCCHYFTLAAPLALAAEH